MSAPTNPGTNIQPNITESYPGLNTAFDGAQRIVDEEFARIDGLDVKASVIIGFSGLLVTFILTAVPSMIRHVDYLTTFFLLTAFLYAFISLICAMLAVVPQGFENAPSIKSLRYYLDKDEQKSRLEIFEAFEGAIHRNEPRIKSKNYFVNLSIVPLFYSILLLPVIIGYQLLCFLSTK